MARARAVAGGEAVGAQEDADAGEPAGELGVEVWDGGALGYAGCELLEEGVESVAEGSGVERAGGCRVGLEIGGDCSHDNLGSASVIMGHPCGALYGAGGWGFGRGG